MESKWNQIAIVINAKCKDSLGSAKYCESAKNSNLIAGYKFQIKNSIPKKLPIDSIVKNKYNFTITWNKLQ